MTGRAVEDRPLRTRGLGVYPLGRKRPATLRDLTLCSDAGSVATVVVARDPRVRGERPPVRDRTIAVGIGSTLLYGLALVIGLLVPSSGYLGMSVLIATPLVIRLMLPLARRLRGS